MTDKRIFILTESELKYNVLVHMAPKMFNDRQTAIEAFNARRREIEAGCTSHETVTVFDTRNCAVFGSLCLSASKTKTGVSWAKTGELQLHAFPAA